MGFRAQGSEFRGPMCGSDFAPSNIIITNSAEAIQKTHLPGQSARRAYLSKLDGIGTIAKLDEIEGQKFKCVLRYTDSLFVRSRKKQKVRVPEYTLSLLPLNLVQFGCCPISFFGFTKLPVEWTAWCDLDPRHRALIHRLYALNARPGYLNPKP
jgi:hypothetical protein